MILTHYDMSFWVWGRFLAPLVAFSPADPDPHTRTPLPQGHSYYPLKPKTKGVVTRDNVTTPPHSYIQIGERH